MVNLLLALGRGGVDEVVHGLAAIRVAVIDSLHPGECTKRL
jgi:hypothetical protein